MNEFKKLIMMANQDIDDGNDADYPPYLCFQAVESDFRVCLGGDFHEHACQYSFNRKDWFDLPARTYTPAIGILQKVYFRANLTPVLMQASNSTKSIGTFSTTKKCRLSGNPTSMLHGMDWTLDSFDTSVPDYGLSYLFRDSKAVSVSRDFFDFKTTPFRACYFMFTSSYFLKGLVIIDSKGSLGSGAFTRIFDRCPIDEIIITNTSTSIQTFSNAFGYTNIKKISLPAISIQYDAYYYICENCGNLEEVFINGRSLTIGGNQYTNHLTGAFANCSKLSKVTYLVTNPLDKRYTNDWLTGVAENGTIILNKFTTWDPEYYRNGDVIETEVDGVVTKEIITWGIPKNWEVKYCDPATLEVKGSREEFLEFKDKDYMTLEYIQTNGNQYIDSQIKLNWNSRIEIDARPSSSTADYTLWGNAYDVNTRTIFSTSNKDTAVSRFGGKSYTGNLYRSGRHVWSSDKNGVYIDGEIIGKWGSDVTNFEHTTSFYILANRISTGTGVQLKASSGTRIYGLKVYENDTLVADMVPALNISQSRPGLYDKVNNRFLTNIGTGEFTY
jgi:hypothetical protein